MTDGTSQGLFIVVAIVIFGIFTLMAYILFEDTLSPALASMFNDATEQATIQLKKTPLDMDIAQSDLGNGTYLLNIMGRTINKELGTTTLTVYNHNLVSMSHISGAYATQLDIDGNEISFSVEDKTNFGIVIPPENYLEKGKSYVMSFDIKVDSGLVSTLGGHSFVSSGSEVYIDGNRVYTEVPKSPTYDSNGNVLTIYRGDWNSGVPFEEYNDGEYHHVVVKLHIDVWEELKQAKNVDIQPNRSIPGTYGVTVKNLQMVEGKKELPYVPHIEDMGIVADTNLEMTVSQKGTYGFYVKDGENAPAYKETTIN